MQLELEQILFESEDKMWHCAWSTDGTLLAACGSDKKCRIWRRADSSTNFSLLQVLGEEESPHTRTIRSCEFAPNNSNVLCTASFDSTCVIWEREHENAQWRPKSTLEGHENEVKSIDWSPTGRLLATSGRDKTCWVWEQFEGEWNCVSVLTGHDGDVKFVKFHPEREDELFSCSYDNTIKVWRQLDPQEDGEFSCMQTLRLQDTVWALCFLQRDKFIACCQDGTLQSFGQNEFAGNAWESLFTVQNAHDRPVFALDAKGEDGVLISASGDNSLALWQIKRETGFISKVSQVTQAHEQDVNCVRVCPSALNNYLVASCGDDGAVKIWKLL